MLHEQRVGSGAVGCSRTCVAIPAQISSKISCYMRAQHSSFPGSATVINNSPDGLLRDYTEVEHIPVPVGAIQTISICPAFAWN